MKITGTLKSVQPTPGKVVVEDNAGHLWRLEFIDPNYQRSGASSRAYRALLGLQKYEGRTIAADIENHPAFGWTIFGRRKLSIEKDAADRRRATVQKQGGAARPVKNLQWFFRKARVNDGAHSYDLRLPVKKAR